MREIPLSIIGPVTHNNNIESYFAIRRIGRYVNSLNDKVLYDGLFVGWVCISYFQGGSTIMTSYSYLFGKSGYN